MESKNYIFANFDWTQLVLIVAKKNGIT